MTQYTPVFQTTTAANVNVPLQQAAVSALLVATVVVMVGALLWYAAGQDFWPAILPLLGAWVGLLVSLTAYFWFRCLAAAEEALWKREVLMQTDLDGDGQVGKPTSHPVLVGARPDAPPETDWLILAEWFVATSFRLGTTAERNLVGRRKPDGLPLTQTEYDELRDTAIAGRYARWKNRLAPLQGWMWLPGQSAASIVQQMTRYTNDVASR